VTPAACSRGQNCLALAILLGLCGCTQPPPAAPAPPYFIQASFQDLPGWPNDPLAEALPALKLQCRRLALLPLDTALGGEGLARTYGGRAGNWADACAALRALPDGADLHAYVQHWFQPYRIDAPALVTGYFEPILAGALTRGGLYQTPVLARPADLAQSKTLDDQGRPIVGRDVEGLIQPYPTRREIEAGALGALAHPIAWLASPEDLFFAQIQGSARVRLAGGGMLRLAFDGRNGRPYTPIGRVLVAQHALAQDQVTMQSIRAWLDAHPAQAQSVMDQNESYVFFKAIPDPDPTLGPEGALGVALTAGRSAAVDKTVVPLASPVFVATTIPDGRAWRHLVLAQDLGSAITGQARIDIFLGVGPDAADWAGKMHQAGTLWLLLPRPAAAGPAS
jgi:membrane-bound lytic murein transglycosylase A